MGLSPRELKLAQFLNMKSYKGTPIPQANPSRNRNDQSDKMDVDAVQFNMTKEEQERCFKENRCFKCKKPGHRAYKCRSGQPSKYNSDNQGRGWSGVTGHDKDRGRGPNPQARTATIDETEQMPEITVEHIKKYLPDAPDEVKEQFLGSCFGQDFLEAQN